MEQIFYILLGSLLALLGGIITQHVQNYLNQIKEDQNLLFEAQSLLLNLYGIMKINQNVSTDFKGLRLNIGEKNYL